MYRALWLTIVKVEQQSEIIRERLTSRPSFNVFDAFKAVDSNNDGKITADELVKTFDRSGFQVTYAEIKGLVERYDKSGDGAISYLEFSDEIRPHSPSKKGMASF
jgi:Ca2+-binding EF-hand superfamily protein